MTDQSSRGFFAQMASFPQAFWWLNWMEMLERLAYYGVRVVIPIYIAQADEVAGLHFTQVQKGIIFFWWAIVQSLTPMFSGGFADRYGYKKTISVSILLKIVGYLLMATQTGFYPFLLGCCVLAFGTAIFKPGIQGSLVQTMQKDNSSIGWGTFYMLVNIGGFLGPPLAHFLYGISWPAVFYGCAIVVSLNFLTMLMYKELSPGVKKRFGAMQIMWETFKRNPIPRISISALFATALGVSYAFSWVTWEGVFVGLVIIIALDFLPPKVLFFTLIMSGFWLMFMQLFDMLPNFIVDWVDSSQMVKDLNLPSWMTNETDRGVQITQEWLINANAGLIVLAVVFISWLVSRMKRLHSIMIGITISSIGLVIAGFTTVGYFCLAGILVFSVGEMLASPKMNEYLGVIAPPGQKGLYMGFANVPLAVGWSIGSLYAGNIYGSMGEKANLAIRYLEEVKNITGVERTEAVAKMQEVMGMDAVEVTNLLWNTYDPYTLWFPFAAIGIVSAIGMVVYGMFARRWEAENV